MTIKERKHREKEMRRLQIMDAAKKVFASKGFCDATVEEIAQEAELSPATLYLYFKNKDELHAVLHIKILKALIEKIENVYHQDISPEEKIKALAKALYEVYETDPMILIDILQSQSTESIRKLSPKILSQIKHYGGDTIRTIAKIFEDGIREEIFLNRDPIALADIVWGLFSGVVLWEETKKGFDPKKDFIKPTLELGIEIISRGVKKN
jgi:AcrR family transcriptional regulator